MNQHKAEQRRQLRRRRRQLDPRQRCRDDAAIAERLWQALAPRRRAHVAIYLAVGSEVNLAPFMPRARHAGWQLWLPAIRGRQLQFLPASQTRRVGPHRIPAPTRGRRRAPWAMSVIVTPLLGFDARGARLGQGGGYYDRALARLRCRRPLVLGVAYDEQELPRIVTEPGDQPLDGIITPTRTLSFAVQ